MRTALLRLSLLTATVGLSCSGEDPAPLTGKPARPTARIDPVVCGSTARVTGTKQSATSVWINGREAVPYDEAKTFSTSVGLSQGEQTVQVSLRSATGDESEPVTLRTFVDGIPAPSPGIDPVPDLLEATPFVLSGTKSPGTAILVNGAEIVPLGDETTWSVSLDLEVGSNPVSVSAKDACDESAPITKDLFYDPSGIAITVDPIPSPACSPMQRLGGTRGAGVDVYVNDLLVAPADMSSVWNHVVDLVAGMNAFTVAGRIGGRSSAPRTLVIEYDRTPPAPPAVDAHPSATASSTLRLTGTKPIETGLLLDGREVLPIGADVTFAVDASLEPGSNFIQLDTVDECGRTSGSPALMTIVRDEAPPTIVVSRPTDGTLVTGIVSIEGTALDDFEVSIVEITVDGDPLRVTRTPRGSSGIDFSSGWDTTTVGDGAHLISVRATDRAGSSSPPVDLTVTVGNHGFVVSDDVGIQEASSGDSNRPAIAVLANGDVAVAWHDNYDTLGAGTDDDILLKVFAQGIVPGTTRLVSDLSGDGTSQNVRMVSGPDGVLHIVWQDDGDLDGDGVGDSDIIYRSFDGTVLGPAVVVSTGTGDGASRYPDLAVDAGNNLHVVWQDDGDLDGDQRPEFDVYYALKGPSGFSAPELLSDGALDGVSTRPRIATTPDRRPHVVWQDDGIDSDPYLDVYVRTRAGAAWETPILISEEPGFQLARNPAIAADPVDPLGVVYVAFDGTGDVTGSGSDDDVYMRLLLSGQTGPLVLLSDQPSDGESAEPDVAVDESGSVHAVFWDNGGAGSSGTDADVFLRTFDGALEPPAPVSDTSMNMLNTEPSTAPRIAVSASALYVVWQDRSDYDGDGIADFDILLRGSAP